DLLDVLHDDNHVLGLNKPSGWPTAHADTDQTMLEVARGYVREKYRKPGNVFLGVVHRLDKPTSGCLLFARTSKAAARLSEQFREGAVEKVYWAVVSAAIPSRGRSGSPIAAGGTGPWQTADAGALDDWLVHDDADQRVKVAAADALGAKPARLLWQVRGRHKNLVWLELRPHTGRKHQLRVQLAARGSPIYGDAKYGSPFRLGHAIGLHARSVTFLHPTRADPVTLTAEVPRHWKGTFAYLLAGPG
ncbi:MAG: RluA family pseudouridine synthase, partial [Fimbriiglobus sp.]